MYRDEIRQQQKRIEWVLEGVESIYGKLTAWETSFIESVRQQFFSTRRLTDAQLEKLEEVYAQVQERKD